MIEQLPVAFELYVENHAVLHEEGFRTLDAQACLASCLVSPLGCGDGVALNSTSFGRQDGC